MTPADIDKIAGLLTLAFEDPSWTPDRVRQEFIDEPGIVTTWVIQYRENIISTATSLLLPEEHPGSGCVHWVGTHPDYRGQGLGYLVSLAVLNDFIRLQCHDAFLRTDDERLAAIKTYLKLGFVPEFKHPSHPQRWETVMAQLKRA